MYMSWYIRSRSLGWDFHNSLFLIWIALVGIQYVMSRGIFVETSFLDLKKLHDGEVFDLCLKCSRVALKFYEKVMNVRFDKVIKFIPYSCRKSFNWNTRRWTQLLVITLKTHILTTEIQVFVRFYWYFCNFPECTFVDKDIWQASVMNVSINLLLVTFF